MYVIKAYVVDASVRKKKKQTSWFSGEENVIPTNKMPHTHSIIIVLFAQCFSQDKTDSAIFVCFLRS